MAVRRDARLVQLTLFVGLTIFVIVVWRMIDAANQKTTHHLAPAAAVSHATERSSSDERLPDEEPSPMKVVSDTYKQVSHDEGLRESIPAYDDMWLEEARVERVGFVEDNEDDTIFLKEAYRADEGVLEPQDQFDEFSKRLYYGEPTDLTFEIEMAWALGIDLKREDEAIAAIYSLTESPNLQIAEQARQAIASLTASRDAYSLEYEEGAYSLDAANDPYYIELRNRAVTDPQPTNRLEAIAELGTYPLPESVDVLEAVVVGESAEENRLEAVTGLVTIASMDFEAARIEMFLKTIVLNEISAIAQAATEALQTLRGIENGA